MVVAEIDVPVAEESCVGQCALLEVPTGARQLASHHARAGAAAPIKMAMMRIASRFTTFPQYNGALRLRLLLRRFALVQSRTGKDVFVRSQIAYTTLARSAMHRDGTMRYAMST
jgi:hypothetical protein